MPHVRALAGPARYEQAPAGPVLRADTTADLLALLEASGAVSGHAARSALLALVERFEAPCADLVSRLARVDGAGPDVRARLGRVGMARLAQAARVGPTVEVGLAQMALLEGLRRWCWEHLAPPDKARFGELIDALAEAEPGPADALDIEAALAPPAAAEAPAEPAPRPKPVGEAPTDPAPPPEAPTPLPNAARSWPGILPAMLA